MKKLYLIVFAVTAFLTSTNGQCPGPNPARATPYITTSGCFVIVSNMIPDAFLRVRNANGDDITIGSSSTEADGSGAVGYNCNSSAAQVVAIKVNPDGSTQSCFAFVAPAIVLPVKLTGYNAQLQSNKRVKLNWATSFEANSYSYIIEKSNDGRTWKTIGNVKASENSTSTVRYSFDDIEALEGSAFYRLVMVDIDGSKSLSKTVYINNKRNTRGTFSVFPNPFKSDVQIVGISAADVNRRSIRLYNAAGKEIGFTITGANAITIDDSAPRGVYILRVQEKTFKLVKE